MPLIDPARLLRCLSPLLDIGTGAIKSEREVDKIYGLMSKYSRKLVSKCIYINILKVTPVDLLDLFMTRGGWEMVNTWLTDAVTNSNHSLMLELIALLHLIPANVDRLKQVEIGRIIKALSKDTSMPVQVQENSKQLLGKWMAIVNPNLQTQTTQQQPMDTSSSTATMDPATSASASEMDDLTGLLDLKDLNSLQFNPDTFNLALDSLGPTPLGVGEVSDIVQVDGDPSKFDDSSTLAVIEAEELSNLNDPHSQYEVNNRDGKMYIKVRPNEGGDMDMIKENETQLLASSAQSQSATDAAGDRKRARKDPTIKKVPGGKPPMRTYEHLYEDASTKKTAGASTTKDKESEKSQAATAVTVTPPKLKAKGKPPMGPSPPATQEKDRKKKSTDTGTSPKAAAEAQARSKKSSGSGHSGAASATAGSGLTKSQRELEEQRQLRIKVKEQKRIAEERRKKAEQEAQLKAQKQRDEETLKSLNLVALGTKQPMAKIPKRPTTTSFADAIGIPGSGDKGSSKEGKDSKSSTSTTNSSIKRQVSQDEKEKLMKSASAGSAKDFAAAIGGGDRQRVISHPKVKMTTKTRGLGLIEDMTKGETGTAPDAPAEGPKTRSADNKEKEKEASKEKEKLEKDKDLMEASKTSSSKSTPKSDGSPTAATMTTPPPPASKIKKKRTSSESSGAQEIGETKKPKLNLNDDSTIVMETDEDEPKTPVSTPDTPPIGQRKAGLQESSLFMDALTATTQSTSRDQRKLKRRSSSTTETPTAASIVKSTTGGNKAESSSTTPPAASKPIFNFYRETLTEGDTGGSGNNSEPDRPDDETKMNTSPPQGGSTPEAEPEPEEGHVPIETNTERNATTATATPKPPAMQIKRRSTAGGMKGELKSILHVHRPNAPRKTVQWVDEVDSAKLVSYFFFEMDETERVNVTKGTAGVLGGFGFGLAEADADAAATVSETVQVQKPMNFTEMKQLEKAQEKNFVKRRGLFGAPDIMEEKIGWSTPKKINLDGLITECEVQSEQIAIQEEREKGTLQVFYFTKHDIPDCPDEAMAVVEHFDPANTMGPVTVIPFEDVPGVTKVTHVETPEDQRRAVRQHMLLQQQQEAAAQFAATQQQQFGGLGVGSAFGIQQQALGTLWGAAAGGTPAANPFALAMAFAATASASSGAANGVGLDSSAWGAQAFQQPPPSLLNPNYANSYQGGQGQNQGYDDYSGGGGGDQLPSFRNHGGGGGGGSGGGGGRGGRGGGRRQFSRFDNTGGGRNHQQGGGGRGGRGGDWDDRQGGGGGDRRNNRMGNQHNFRDGGGGSGRGGRDFRGGRGGHDDGPQKRERGRGRTVLCKFFAQGTCKAGPACDFLHPGINGPNRGGRFNNSGSGNANDWQQQRAPPRRRDGGGSGGEEGYSNASAKDYQTHDEDQETSPASPEPDPLLGANSTSHHRPIEFGSEES